MTDDAPAPPAESPGPSRLSVTPRLRRRLGILALGLFFLSIITVILVVNLLEYLSMRDEVNPSPTLSPPSSSRARVDLGYAIYDGSRLANGVDQYLGMRYAAAPLGDLRWRAPRDATPENGPQEAFTYRPTCLATNAGPSPGGQAEDCLFANVWAPANATTASKLPVWVFIQGGGYTANSNSNWNGSEVVEKSGRNIVFVEFNYRVGLWGFLAGREVAEKGNLNAGFLDQIHMLKWVQKHITTFGGDPSRVVIHGISAGAGSVALHLTSHGGRNDGLFAAAIAQSVFFPAQPRVDELDYQFNRTVQLAGCADATDRMACLRGKDQATLQRANTQAPFPGRSGGPLWYWTPCLDGEVIRDAPYSMFARGEYVKVPTIVGSCNDEGSFFAPNLNLQDEFRTWMQDQYPLFTNSGLQTMLSHYPLLASMPSRPAWFPSASRAYGESTFICPGNTILNTFAGSNASSKLWSWRFNVFDQDNYNRGVGVPHVFDAPAVFGPHNLPSPASYFSYNAPVVPLMMHYIVSFVRTLDPNRHRYEGAPVWETWGSEKDQRRLVIELGTTHMETVDEGQRTRCAFWKDVGPSLRQKV